MTNENVPRNKVVPDKSRSSSIGIVRLSHGGSVLVLKVLSAIDITGTVAIRAEAVSQIAR